MPSSCPRCQKSVDSLQVVEPQLQLRLLDISLAESEHAQLCSDCLQLLKRVVANPNELKHKLNSENSHKQNLWSNRSDVLKLARQALSENHWAQASQNFVSYIEALETVFDQKSGTLTPDVFRAMNKIEEMKTLVLVYWELVQIHDGKNEKLTDLYSGQLAKFGKCSPLKTVLLDKLKDYESRAVFKKYIKRTDRELRGEKGLFSFFKAS